MSNIINIENRIEVRNWFTAQLKAQGISYVRLYSNKAKKHPKAVHGYRMKYYAVKRDQHRNVSIVTRLEFINAKAKALGIPFALERDLSLNGYLHTVQSLRIVPVSACTSD
ncbi:UNVERIFIED_ORG: hypothetical protein GCAPEGMB_00400 [Vibrio phage V07]